MHVHAYVYVLYMDFVYVFVVCWFVHMWWMWCVVCDMLMYVSVMCSMCVCGVQCVVCVYV